MSVIQKVMEAVVKLLPDAPVDPLIATRDAVGQPLSRVDGPLKVSGTARFTAEVAYDGLLYATMICSTIAKGRISRLDTADAIRAHGISLVMTHENAPKMAPPPQLFTDPKAASFSNLPVMQDAKIHWNGQPIALIVAETQEQADYAATLVCVTYDLEPADLSFETLKSGAKSPKHIMGEDAAVSVGGDAEAALAAAEFRVDQIYRTSRNTQNAIELHATTALWDGNERLIVHDASQSLEGARYTFAKVFGLKPENVRVHAPFVGGAFGNKTVSCHQLLCIAAAKLTGRPVRIVLTREDVFRVVGGRTLSEQRVALGAKRDGKLSALIHTGTTAMTAHNEFPEQFTFPARHLYAADTLLLEQNVVLLDMVANTSMRAPGESIGTFALESALDELAIKMNIDPIDLRRRIEPGIDPTKNTPFSSRNIIQAYAAGAERFRWADRNLVPGSRREGEWLIGQGVATAYYPYHRMPSGIARIRLTVDGRAVVQMASHELGMGTATVQSQHAADRLGLPVDRVAFEYGDTNLPTGTVAGGSSQTVSIIAAVIAAQGALVKKLLKLAGNTSPLAGAKPDEVHSRAGGLYLNDVPDQGETYISILANAGREQVEAEAVASNPNEIVKYSMHSYGAQFCEVRVNDVTGEIRVSRFLGSFDTGSVLNPKTAASQFRGGIIMGLGLALTEESLFDERSGRFMNPSLAEYHVPVHADVPEIDVMWTDIPDPHAPMGVHGVGEIGITGVAAAVANAVYNATGKRIRELPITLDKVLAA